MTEQSKSTDKIYHQIREKLLEQQLEEGTRIDQNGLAASLGVSRTPVIKALHMLESEGLVDNLPNRGFFVHTTTLRELTELFVLRQGMEMVAASSMVYSGTDEQFDELEACFADFRDGSPIDPVAYYKADRMFHTKMLRMCDNSLLHKVNDSLQLMERSFSFGLLRPAEVTLQEHLDIINTLRARDAVEAMRVTRAHTEITKENMLNLDRQMRMLGIDSSRLSVKDVFTQRLNSEKLL